MSDNTTAPGGDGDQAVAASNRDIAVQPERERKGAGAGRMSEYWFTKQTQTLYQLRCQELFT